VSFGIMNRYLSVCINENMVAISFPFVDSAAPVLPGTTPVCKCTTTRRFASVANPPLRTEQIVEELVERNLERAQALHAYLGSRIYRVEYRGFPGGRSAEMVVDVKYQSPGTKEFTIRSATGSKMIIDKVFKKLLQAEKRRWP
jgi:hypothetical protein